MNDEYDKRDRVDFNPCKKQTFDEDRKPVLINHLQDKRE